MSRQKSSILALFLISVVCLSACANRSSSGNSSALLHGFGESSSASAQIGDAKVTKVVPDVVAIHDGRADKLSVGMLIPSNSILRSDDNGSAEIAFSNGSKINISPNSELDLASVAPAVAASQNDKGSSKGLTRKLNDAFGRTGARSTKQATLGVRGLK